MVDLRKDKNKNARSPNLFLSCVFSLKIHVLELYPWLSENASVEKENHLNQTIMFKFYVTLPGCMDFHFYLVFFGGCTKACV